MRVILSKISKLCGSVSLSALVALGACQALNTESTLDQAALTESFTVSSVNPGIANIAGGSELEIHGTGFGSDAIVALGDYSCASLSVENSHLIKCVVPALSDTGTVDVRVWLKDRGPSLVLSQALSLTDDPAPIILGLSSDDTDGPLKLNVAGGSKVTVFVRDVSAGAVLYIGDKVCSKQETQFLAIVCQTESSLPKTVKVKIVNPDGQTAVSASDLEYSGVLTQALMQNLIWKPMACINCHGNAKAVNGLNLEATRMPTAALRASIKQRVNLSPKQQGFEPRDSGVSLSAEQLNAISLWVDQNAGNP